MNAPHIISWTKAEKEDQVGETGIFSVMSQAEPEPDLDQTHGSLVQLIMQDCRQLWQTERDGKRREAMRKMKENEGKRMKRR